jgi:PilZ domain-containing protein
MQTSTHLSKQRAERRIAVRLPMQVTGRDSRGVVFTEETSSENLCRNGAAFVTRFEVAIGSDLDIRIPQSHQAWRREESDFATRGRVVHVAASGPGKKLVGVQFTGPRFQKVFRSESAA